MPQRVADYFVVAGFNPENAKVLKIQLIYTIFQSLLKNLIKLNKSINDVSPKYNHYTIFNIFKV